MDSLTDMAGSAIPILQVNTDWEHLTDGLGFLNVCLLREVRRRAHGSEQGQLDHLRGLVLDEREIIAILTGQSEYQDTPDCEEELEQRLREIEERVSRLRAGGGLRATPPLAQITALFQLERIEALCLLLCLAQEIDSNYSKVFAFIQDDVTKQQPSVDLALKLFCKEMQERIVARSIFSPNSTLLRNRLLHLGEAPDGQSTFMQRWLKLDDRVAAFLLGASQPDSLLCDWVELVDPSDEPERAVMPVEVWERTLHMVESCFSGGAARIRPLLHFYGQPGSGRRAIAERLSQVLGLPLLVGDVSRMPMAASERAEALWRLGRESLLLPAVIFIDHFDELLQEGRGGELAAFLDSVEEFSPLTCLAGTQPWKVTRPVQLFLSLECPVPDSTTRIGLWKKRLLNTEHGLSEDELVELSSKFNFTDGQIRDALEAAQARAYWETQPPQPLTAALLNQACRSVATPSLGGLARKIEPCHSWADIVLPETQLGQLTEIAAHVKRAPLVLNTWGFARKWPYGKGITALFEGMSGTGKTMAAGIIGAELGLDLYKIDLSCVVSKYIGETEKNLNRIFNEAQDSSAILFFDEADALFGKRSEVKDAHDRYANIETAYLLQKMEEYSGIVILATNMKRNLDEAFIRRMRFIVHFPFPNDEYRQLIWEKAFPREAPLDSDVDFGWFARKLKITGGQIKNISLRAAFLAIERRGVISMDCLVDAARREIEKMGKVSTLTDFRASLSPEEAFAAVEVA